MLQHVKRPKIKMSVKLKELSRSSQLELVTKFRDKNDFSSSSCRSYKSLFTRKQKVFFPLGAIVENVNCNDLTKWYTSYIDTSSSYISADQKSDLTILMNKEEQEHDWTRNRHIALKKEAVKGIL